MRANTGDRWIAERTKRYGPISKLSLFGKPSVFIHGQAANKLVFTSDDSIMNKHQTESIKMILGNRACWNSVVKIISEFLEDCGRSPVSFPFTRFSQSLKASAKVQTMLKNLVREKRVEVENGASSHQTSLPAYAAFTEKMTENWYQKTRVYPRSCSLWSRGMTLQPS
ncbi:cytochrome P450 716B1-like [Olea europaea subsp. europaea]|uniref:Cytochrome P450 716B1-like n=1 Tax=Olea europaea subsp. europaea TaxID=158383 RepID=A0A8S0UYB7_OLEEU|nr:cytochrome P450 716B1-like [Olea europaea subsp. europaea]